MKDIWCWPLKDNNIVPDLVLAPWYRPNNDISIEFEIKDIL